MVLVDEGDAPVGVGRKLGVHRCGLLHRAFSVFGFSVGGELLLARRADRKYHSGGLWSSTCFSHSAAEDVRTAARRRLAEELGLGCSELRRVGVLRYRASLGELVENELLEFTPWFWRAWEIVAAHVGRSGMPASLGELSLGS